MTSNKQTIDVVLVEDSDLQRMALRTGLGSYSEIQIIGEAVDGESAVKTILAKKPAVALVDIGLPVMDGIAVTRLVKEVLPTTRVLILTARDGDRDVLECFSARADGYVLKAALNAQYVGLLASAIQTVRDGWVWLDPKLAVHVLNYVKGESTENRSGVIDFISASDRRRLQAIAENGNSDSCLIDVTFAATLSQFAELSA